MSEAYVEGCVKQQIGNGGFVGYELCMDEKTGLRRELEQGGTYKIDLRTNADGVTLEDVPRVYVAMIGKDHKDIYDALLGIGEEAAKDSSSSSASDDESDDNKNDASSSSDSEED